MQQETSEQHNGHVENAGNVENAPESSTSSDAPTSAKPESGPSAAPLADSIADTAADDIMVEEDEDPLMFIQGPIQLIKKEYFFKSKIQRFIEII